MFRQILVPLDFTEKNNQAIDLAIKMAKQDAGRVTLLHVIETLEYEDDEIKAFYENLENKAWSRMKPLAERVIDAGVAVDQHILFGRRGNCIVAYVTDNDVDLVILSSHKIELDRPPVGWATLSYQISILCPCPVLLVK